MNDNKRDQELDELLNPLRKSNPRSQDIGAWKNAVAGARTKRGFRGLLQLWPALPQVAAALALGFIVGAIVFHRAPQNFENSAASATIEEIYAKAE
jgi:hypothetical protein